MTPQHQSVCTMPEVSAGMDYWAEPREKAYWPVPICIQKVAKMPIMGPLFVLGMNSVKYENTTGMAAPTLRK